MRKPRNDGDFPFWRLWVIGQWIVLAALLLFVAYTLRGQEAPREAVQRVTLSEAIHRALAPDGNARVAIVKEIAAQAKARSAQARADLLPNLDGAVSQSSQTRNLQALGINLAIPLPGFEPPRFVGPFNVFDARISATQQLFSISAVRRYQSAREGLDAARAEEEHARQVVTMLVAKAYFAVQRAEAQLAAAEATLALANELEALANQQKTAGTGIALDVTRASVQRSVAEQARLARETELTAARLQLLRVMGEGLDARVRLAEKMQPPLDDVPTLASALSAALGERADLRGQEARTEGARLLLASAKWERAPMVAAFGDYGASGNTPNRSLATRAVGVTARIPLFDGGRRDARRAEAAAKAREEEIRTHDLKQQIELDLRLALDALSSSRSQVLVAMEAFQQSELELEQARRRYQAGVSSSLEITRAQTSVEQARVAQIDALFRYQLARVDFAFASGRAETIVQ
ncbi:MAG: TolC family protein [Bryobacterales bacterium]|nr:TolC family protein [Bryobacterales bacterium]